MMDLERISRLRKEYGNIAIATVVKTKGSTPRAAGATLIILPDGKTEGTIGGGKFEMLVTRDAVQLMKKGGCSYKRYRLLPKAVKGIGVECGGSADVFIEVTHDIEHLILFGAGHIGQALANMAVQLDFKVTVIDDRKEYAVSDRFKGAQVICTKYNDPAIPRLIGPQTYTVIATHAHMNDATVLHIILSTKARYIGMIGSKRKVLEVKNQLIKRGVSKKSLDSVYAPIGLDIGAESPAEIAISILSEIVNIRRKKRPSLLGLGRRH